MKRKIKKIVLKVPFLYRFLSKISKKIKKIDEEREGVYYGELNYMLNKIGKNKLVLEIGAFKGQTTKDLAKDNTVVGIEPFFPDDISGTLQGEYVKDVQLEFMKNTLGKNILLIPNISEIAFLIWDNYIQKNFDAIFVDGLHTYKGVEVDWKWVKYLNKDGLVFFHDTGMEGVKIDKNFKEVDGFTYPREEYGIRTFKKIK